MNHDLVLSVAANPSSNLFLWWRQQVAEFEARAGVHVHVEFLAWDRGRPALTQMALLRRSPDVSIIGSTWTTDLLALNALRPFSEAEINTLGGVEAFFPMAWQTCKKPGNTHICAIPWTIEPTMIFYRQDWLEQAGLDPQEAFHSFSNVEQTLEILRNSIAPSPLSIPVDLRHSPHQAIECMASWVWDAGGDLISPDGQKVLFDQPETLAGLYRYFNTRQYLHPDIQSCRSHLDMFFNGQAAITFGGGWIVSPGLGRPPEILDRLGCIQVPGAGFLGGSNIVIWKDSRNPQIAFDLVQYLCSSEMLERAWQRSNVMPARIDLLSIVEASPNKFQYPRVQAARAGRVIPCHPLWGVAEELLGLAIISVWQEILATPGTSLQAAVNRYIIPLVSRFNAPQKKTRRKNG